MSVLKRNSVYFGGGVDISNTIDLKRFQPAPEPAQPAKQEPQPEEPKKPDPEQELLEAKRRLDDKLQQVAFREKQLEQQKKELEELKERCVQQGKDIILEAKNRAESIIRTANDNASQIVSDAEANRDSVYIKAKAEGFEQGTRDGREACFAAFRGLRKRDIRHCNADSEESHAGQHYFKGQRGSQAPNKEGGEGIPQLRARQDNP